MKIESMVTLWDNFAIYSSKKNVLQEILEVLSIQNYKIDRILAA